MQYNSRNMNNVEPVLCEMKNLIDGQKKKPLEDGAGWITR